ncbi:protein RCC2-like [Argonauta hians]
MPPKKRNSDDDASLDVKRRRKKNGNEDDYSHCIPLESDSDNDSLDIKLEGSLVNGEVLFCGGTNWCQMGRKVQKGGKNAGMSNLWGPHRISNLCGVRVRSVVSGCTACHNVIITAEGKVMTWGRNEKGQLGHGDDIQKDIPTLVESFADEVIIEAACGKNHTLFLTEKGKVYSCGDNRMSQLGIGHQSPSVPSPVAVHYKGPPVRKLACGAEFSMIVDVRGSLYSFGCPEYGQLGNNSDGKYFVTSNKLSYKCLLVPKRVQVFIEKTRDGHVIPVTEVDIIDVSCGMNHVVALDSRKRVFTWGFGGYGRLGHSEPKDEFVPRMVKAFDGPNRGAAHVYGGGTFCLAVNEHGSLYFWGQTKYTGEASMYPKLVQDLAGWRVRSVACSNRSIVVAADESIVSWGPSPTYGELGYGSNKPHSSTVPQEVKTLDGIYIHSVACGYGHTLFLARADTEANREKIERLPIFKP